MKAVRFHAVQDVRCDEVEKPSIEADDEVLVRVQYAGICGSDLHTYHKAMFDMIVPQTMGHEYVGRVEKTGPAVQGLEVGDYVVENPMLPCGKCESCRKGSFHTCDSLSFIGEMARGCFAPYIVSKASKLIRVPQTERIRQVALSEPLAVALNICRRAQLDKKDKLAVIGAGPIGLLTIAAAKKLYGVTCITAVDLSQTRLELAKKAGADVTATAFPEGKTMDKIVDAAGVQATFRQGINHLTAGGTLYVVSIFENELHCDINTIVAKQLSVVGCNVYTRRELEEAVSYISAGVIEVDFLITHEFLPEQCQQAFTLLSGLEKNVAKVLFKL